MAERGDAYALTTPVVKRRDTVTSQLQREILGFSAAMGAAGYGRGGGAESPGQGDLDIAGSDRRKEANPEPAAAAAGEAERRRTLSPTSASVLLRLEAVDDSAISRTDTVSPTAMRRVLLEDDALGGGDAPPIALSAASDEDVDLEQVAQLRELAEASRKGSPAVGAAQRRTRRRSSEQALSSPATATRSGSNQSPGKRARASPTKRASPAKQAKAAATDEDERRRSTTNDSFTEGLFSSSLLNQHAAAEEEEKDGGGISQQTTLVDSFASSQDRRATLEPTEVETFMAEIDEAAADDADPAPIGATTLRRQTISSHSVSALSSEAGVRRSTLDPRDLSLIQSEKAGAERAGGRAAAASEGLRRQTIGDSELEELNSVLGNVSMGDEAPGRSPARVVGSRKRTDAFDATADEQALKRVKTSSPSRPTSKAAAGTSQHQTEKQRSPARTTSSGHFSSPSRIPRPRQSKAALQSRSPDAAAGVDLASSPAQSTRSKAPLRGILSARKRAKDQTTPTKSVNFGPPQGAEFNHGSPSTSMTPMNANKAHAMFPLDRPSTPDDDETSLNSSILDEADARSPDPDLNKASQDDTLDGEDDRRSSLAVLQSANKTRRRYSLRGVSPLDNQREARRRRRASAIGGTSTTTTSTGISLAPSQIPKPFQSNSTSQSSFLADASLSLQDPTPYADSSASSDVGEDMELTGEHSFQASAVFQETINIMASSVRARGGNAADVDEEDHTVELGSLGDLLAESAAYELPSAASVVAAAAASRINQSHDHETTLDPIREESESGANSSRQSMMSLASSADDSDADEGGERRSSLAVNLSAQFERIGSASKAGQSSASDDSSANDAIATAPIELSVLVSSVELDKTQTAVTSGPAFFESDPAAATTPTSFLCSAEACLDVVEWHAKEISSWSEGLTDVLPALLSETAPTFLGSERDADDIKQAVKDLFAGEVASVRSGWCQWRARMETQMAEKLSECANNLEADVSSLKATVANDVVQRQSEVAAIQELIERETQMAQLLDAIEEQQSVNNEFAAAVATLENQCSSLALEESVLQTQLRVLEGRAHELEPVTASKAILTQHELLEIEEVFSIQENLSGWRIVEATSTHVKMSAKHEDVLFDVDVDISVVIHSPEDEEAPFSVTLKAREAIKRRKQSVYLRPERDVALLVQRQLFDSTRLAVVVGEARGRSGAQNRHARLCSNVQLLQNYVAQSFQFLRELRELSTHFSLSLDMTQRMLWVQFIKFPPSPNESDALGTKFRVGLAFVHSAPFVSGEVKVDVSYGSVSADSVTKAVSRVSRSQIEYFSRVCRRIHDMFVRR